MKKTPHARRALSCMTTALLTGLAASLLLVLMGIWLQGARAGAHEEVEAASRVAQQWLAALAAELGELPDDLGVLGVAAEGGEGLDRRGRQRQQQLAQMGTAAHVGEHFAHRLAEALDQIQPHQLPVGRRDGLAAARIGHPRRHRAGVHDIELGVDGDPQEQVVDRLTGLAQA